MSNIVIAFSVIFVLSVSEIQGGIVKSEASTVSTEKSISDGSICDSNTACAWSVDNNLSTKKFSSFIKNTCKCSNDKSCVPNEQILSKDTSYTSYRCAYRHVSMVRRTTKSNNDDKKQSSNNSTSYS